MSKHPFTRTQIKQLRRAAAKHELKARENGKGRSWGFPGYFVPSYTSSAAKWAFNMKRARKARKRLRSEKEYQARVNYSEPINIWHHLASHKTALRFAKETRTVGFANRLP